MIKNCNLYVRSVSAVDAERHFHRQHDKDPNDGSDKATGHFLRFDTDVLSLAQVASCRADSVDKDIHVFRFALGQQNVDEVIQESCTALVAQMKLVFLHGGREGG